MEIAAIHENKRNIKVKEFTTSMLLIAASVALVAFGCSSFFLPALCVGAGLALVGIVGVYYSVQRKKEDQKRVELVAINHIDANLYGL